MAYPFNDPIIVAEGTEEITHSLSPLIRASSNFIIETVKQAEDGDGIIIRGYECNRQRGWISFTAGFPLSEVHMCNLLEQNQQVIPVEDSKFKLYIKPFEIVTLRLES